VIETMIFWLGLILGIALSTLYFKSFKKKETEKFNNIESAIKWLNDKGYKVNLLQRFKNE